MSLGTPLTMTVFDLIAIICATGWFVYSIVVLIVGRLFTAEDGAETSKQDCLWAIDFVLFGTLFCLLLFAGACDTKIEDGLISSDLIHVGDYPTFCLIISSVILALSDFARSWKTLLGDSKFAKTIFLWTGWIVSSVITIVGIIGIVHAHASAGFIAVWISALLSPVAISVGGFIHERCGDKEHRKTSMFFSVFGILALAVSCYLAYGFVPVQ